MFNLQKAQDLAPITVKPNSPQALALMWSMLTTHPEWVGSDDVPYDKIDQALNITPGSSEILWAWASNRDNIDTVTKTGQAFQKFTDPEAGPVFPAGNPWAGKQCNPGQFVHMLNPAVDITTFPDIG